MIKLLNPSVIGFTNSSVKNIFIPLLFAVIAFTGCVPKQLVYPKQSAVLPYKYLDSSSLNLHFFYPPHFKTNKKYPVLVLFFGGGWKAGSVYQFDRHAKYFASRGLITVLADYRVSNRYSSTPFDAVKDAKSAIRFLRQHADSLHIKPDRIIAGGGSAGGHLAAAADLTQLDDSNEDLSVSSRPNALVLFNPVFDNGPGGYGYDRIGDRYPEISPLHNIKKGAAPSIVFLGTSDNLIPVATAELYKKRMEEVGSRCDLFLYEGQKHGFFNASKYFYKTVKQADIFLRSLGYLKGKPRITEDTFANIHSLYK